MPEVDGKRFAYTEKGKKAAAAAKKRKGKSGDSFASKYMYMMPGAQEKYAKGRERQEEIDSGKRVVGKKTGTLPKQSAADTRKAKKAGKGVQRAGEYVQKRADADRYYGQTGFSDQMDYEDANTTEGYEKAHKKHMKTRADGKAARRKLAREYPKPAAHRKSMEKAGDAAWDAYANREKGSDGQAVSDNAFIKSRATDKKKAKKKAAAKKRRAAASTDAAQGSQHHMMMDTGPLEMKKVKRKKKALPKKIKLKKVPHKGDKTKAQKAGDAEKKRLAAASPPKKKKKADKKTGKKPLPRTPYPPA